MSVLHNIVMNLNNVMGTRGRYSPPPNRVVARLENPDFLDLTENCRNPPNFKKNIALAFLNVIYCPQILY